MKSLAKSRFVTDTLVFVVSSCFINAFNYLFLLIGVRFLSSAEYGVFNSLVMCMVIAGVVGNCLQLRICRELAETPSILKRYLRPAPRTVLKWGLVMLIAALLTQPAVRSLLGATTSEVLWLDAGVACLFAATVANGLTSGIRALKFQGLCNLTGTLLKLLGGWLLLFRGAGVSGGLAAYVIGFAVVTVWSGFFLRRAPIEGISVEGKSGAVRTESPSLPWLIAAYTLLIAPFALDQILVQALWRETSGEYAAAATLGKLAFYAAAPCFSVVYPYLVGSHSNWRRQAAYFHAGTLLAIVIAVGVAAFFLLMGPRGVSLILSPRYLPVTQALPPYLFGMIFYVVAYGVAMLAIAKRESSLIAALGAAAVLQVLLFARRSGDLQVLVWNQFLSCLVLAVLVGCTYVRILARERRSR